MTIHWQLIPLILTGILFLLFQLAGGNRGLESEIQLGLGAVFALCLYGTIILYITLGIAWLIQNIHII